MKRLTVLAAGVSFGLLGVVLYARMKSATRTSASIVSKTQMAISKDVGARVVSAAERSVFPSGSDVSGPDQPISSETYSPAHVAWKAETRSLFDAFKADWRDPSIEQAEIEKAVRQSGASREPWIGGVASVETALRKAIPQLSGFSCFRAGCIATISRSDTADSIDLQAVVRDETASWPGGKIVSGPIERVPRLFVTNVILVRPDAD